ncbi:thiosulfate oxidation carrier protein SoxY [Thiothrix nivea]|uniref:Sulfur oxidation protein SoxY-like protein n=1 Tax=Thiothrix nivea (strain ATCC 35100 / DSM 5205 / JP2) TaxID=870187 RepID=A0A656HGP5_THINJ|nr:thiosulfate oxidation carrier protein SoxY [Thiothrix nivea]EIJ34662.1 sulfur oxidation protein SoxY-like protein [Thiothrix nivea DSM 5205]EIJ34666.1 thiosulfate-binding protein SoxY [Thiothrix nivea DSM 5205]
MKRRTFLQGSLAAGAAGMAVSAGLLTPRMVLADGSAFDAKTLDDTLKAMAITPEESGDVKIKAPEIAENGAVVPVTVTGPEGTTELSILVENNPNPLAATFILGEGAKPEASTRIKMGKTSNVIALAKVGDKTLSAKQEVKVTIGGCGG